MPGPIRRLLLCPVVAAVMVGAGLAVTPTAAQAAGPVTAVVRVKGSLQVRKGPSTGTTAVGTLRDKARVRISCWVNGQQVRGTVRSTRAWVRLTNGGYLSHAYLRNTARISACRVPAAPSVVTGTVTTGDGPVNLRTGPWTTAPVTGSAGNGTRLQLTCAVTGEYVTGSVRATAVWDRLADGRYVSHGYVTAPALPACADAPTPTPTLTNAQFIAAAVPGAQQGWREFGVPPSVTIAQAILESGWGRSGLAAVDRNYFGIKCFNGSPGTIAAGCHTYRTFECDKAGACFPTEASFRTYRKVADSFRDHGHFLRVNSRYKPAFAHTRDANRFLHAIWTAGYATDPQYYTKVTSLMRSYQLYQYDTWK